MGVHRCTEKDYKKFYEPSKNSKPRIKDFKDKNAWWCMDEYEEKDGKKLPLNRQLFGSGDAQPNRSLGVVFVPCIPDQITPENEGQKDEKCLADYTGEKDEDGLTPSLRKRWNESKRYLGSPDLNIWINKEEEKID